MTKPRTFLLPSTHHANTGRYDMTIAEEILKETRKQNKYLRNISTVATCTFFAGLLAMAVSCILVIL